MAQAQPVEEVESIESQQVQENLVECIDLDEESRLACYDRIANDYERTLQVEDIRPANALDLRLKLEEKLADNRFLIIPHRRNYILPYTYNNHPNPVVESPTREAINLVNDYRHYEAKYQLSFKVQLLRNALPERLSAWFGYTQLGFWQVYNAEASKPFRSIDHEPELALIYRSELEVFGYSSGYYLLGINHQSNGRSEPQSRSWNRVFSQFLFNKGNLTLGVRPWYRIPEDEDEDDNPDIQSYLGYAEFQVAYKSGENIFDIRLLNNFRERDNRTSVELSITLPLPGRMKGYFQYYNGYGEALIDYNHRNQRFGLGILLTDLY